MDFSPLSELKRMITGHTYLKESSKREKIDSKTLKVGQRSGVGHDDENSKSKIYSKAIHSVNLTHDVFWLHTRLLKHFTAT